MYFSTGDFMKLTRYYIHLKSDSNSKLKGYWTSEIGGLNEVTHIWEYGNNYLISSLYFTYIKIYY